MDDQQPFMLVRARARDAARPDFDSWFETVHLRDIANIPGVARVRKGQNADGTRLGVYTFVSTEAVQPALASPQAAYARGTWERWQPDLEELLIELWSASYPIPLYHGIN